MDFGTGLSNQTIIILDGAMGTELSQKGLETDAAVNLTHPEAVLQVHRDYLAAGAAGIITNTLVANRIYLETHGLAGDVEAVNRSAVQLARKAAGRERWVLGDLSSTGQLLEPYGNFTVSQFCDSFKEQAEILAANGVDGFIIETMIDLREALCALKACRDISALPVIVSLSFATLTGGGRTVMGNSAREFAVAVADHGGTVIGMNCGDLTPAELAEIVGQLRQETVLPIAVQPNAGKPVLLDEETHFEMTPTDFAAGIRQCIAAGASIVGGCCGTTPDHIRAIADMVRNLR